ncbi:histidine kinase-like protein [Streptomyces sp. TLI_235]|nr:ATP-binding protein [Streptomyces sp. TLI_235]PBC75533.1 histidine kinase-like protein [Streptomyces sp. TLI_235]
MDNADGREMKALGWARTLPVSSGVRAGRAWARRHLDDLGCTGHAPDAADAVVLSISELVTNAHRHAGSAADLVLTWDGRCPYVSVHDESAVLPRQRDAGPEATGGRGIAMVDALSDGWQTRADRCGKTVTACFHPSGRVTH